MSLHVSQRVSRDRLRAVRAIGPAILWDRTPPASMPDNGNMQDWPDRRLIDLLNIEFPIIQAPMAGSDSVALARSVSSTGALGSLACALLSPDDVRTAISALRHEMAPPFNLNFFCHAMEAPDAPRKKSGRVFETALSALGPGHRRQLRRAGFDCHSMTRCAQLSRRSSRRS